MRVRERETDTSNVGFEKHTSRNVLNEGKIHTRGL